MFDGFDGFDGCWTEPGVVLGGRWGSLVFSAVRIFRIAPLHPMCTHQAAEASCVNSNRSIRTGLRQRATAQHRREKIPALCNLGRGGSGMDSLGDFVDVDAEAVMIGPFSAFHTKACLAVAAARPTVGAVGKAVSFCFRCCSFTYFCSV